MSGYVYAIGDGEGRVKIGWSADPVRRLNKINSDCPGQVRLLGAIDATREQEAEAHQLLERWRITGEWFRLDGAVRDFVEALPQLGPRPRQTSNGHPLQDYRRRAGVTLKELADKLGVSHASMSRIENGKQEIVADGTDALLFKIVELTGVPAEALRPDLAELFGIAS